MISGSYDGAMCSYCQLRLRTTNSAYCKEHKNLSEKLRRTGLRMNSVTGRKINGAYVGKSMAPLQIDVQVHFHNCILSDEEIRSMVSVLKRSPRWIPWLYERSPPDTEGRRITHNWLS